jgi:hypothetical protein
MPEDEPWEYSLYIPNDPRAVTISRRTLRLILTMHGLIRLVDVAELLATELITNAVRHTKGPAALRVRWSAGVLRIGAWDADPPTCGAGIRSPGSATGASTCGASSPVSTASPVSPVSPAGPRRRRRLPGCGRGGPTSPGCGSHGS